MLKPGQSRKTAATEPLFVCAFLGDKMDEYYMKLAIKEAQKSLLTNDVPVGALIVDSDGNIISKAHNIKEKNQSLIDHAEIIAINKANKKINNWHLDDYTMYVTLEPCMMCTGAIIESRIKRLVYGTTSPKYGYIESVEHAGTDPQKSNLQVTSNICQEDCENLLKTFFKTLRP
jgi:tRNA(adenine34) deaminase